MRVLRWLCQFVLRAYPPAFRGEQGAEIVEVIVDRVRRRARTDGTTTALTFASRELWALLAGILRARRLSARTRSDRALWTRLFATIHADVAYTFRGWTRHPGYVVIIVATLALGIGANTALFSVVNGVLLRPLAYRDAERLVLLWDRFDGGQRTWVHNAQVRALRDEAVSFSDVAAMEMVSGRILGGDRPVHTDVGRVSSNFFEVLGVSAVLGRTFVTGDDDWRAPWVAVLSHEYWTRELAQDPGVIGRNLIIGFPEMEIVGVLPPTFDYRMYEALGERTRPEIWIPHQVDYQTAATPNPGAGVAVLARLADGVTVEDAESELASLAPRHAERFFEREALSYDMVPLHGDVVAPVRAMLILLLGAVGFVLLVAIANVATLVLARTYYRTSELAVRMSLGASAARITRQLMTENLVLAGVATVIGVALAPLGLDLLLALAPVEIPRVTEIAIDLRVLGFAAAAGLVAGIVPGLVPLVQLRWRDSMQGLNRAARAGMETARARTVRHALVIGQVGLTVVLLSGGALMSHSLLRLHALDPGFDDDAALTFSVFLMQEYGTPQKRNAFFREAAQRIAAIPGVRSVGATTALPLSAPTYGPVFRAPPGRTIQYALWPGHGTEPDPAVFDPATWIMADINTTRPGYFAAAGIPVLAGADFTEADTVRTQPFVLVDDRLASELWPGKLAVGQMLWAFNGSLEVKGVVRHSRHQGLGEDGRPQLYIPYAFLPTTLRTSMVVRTETDPVALLPAIRDAIASIDPLVPIADIKTLEMIVDESTAGVRFTAVMLGGFAGAALLLAILGVHGVLAFSVARQRRQIAVRVALGGTRARIARLVVTHAVRLVGAGAVLGIVVGWPLARAARGDLLHVAPTDPWALLAAGAGMVAVAAIAALNPMLRATAIEPASILRGE